MSNQERTVLFQLPTVISGQLVCTQGTLAGRSWNLSAGTFVIGRAAGSDMTLSAEPGVSKLHAKILAEGDHYSLVDNESRNGTIVNGRPVQKVRLKTGDQIRICNCVLRFTQTGAGIPISAEGPPVSAADDAPAFDLAPATSPEVREMTAAAAPPSIEAPPPAPAPRVPPPSAPAVQEPLTASVELPRPAPEIRVQSAMPWFVGGLAIMLLVGGAGWAGLRMFGDALLGPATETVAAKDPIALEREAEEARAKAAADERKASDDVKLAQADDAVPAAADDGTPSIDDEEAAEAAPPDDEAASEGTDPPADDDTAGANADDGDDADDGAGKVAAADPTPSETRRTGKASKTATADSEDAESASVQATRTPPTRSWYPVVVEREGPMSVKARAGGTVASVAASDGQSVRKGELLFSFEDEGGDEISNLRANIEALEAVAESQPSAQDMLERERDKLKRLLAKSGDVNVTAPVAGTLSGFGVKVGDVLKGGESVGVVERGGATLVVTVPAAEGRRIRRGAAVELKTTSGTASGRVASVKRRGASYQVVLSTDASPGDVTEARF